MDKFFSIDDVFSKEQKEPSDCLQQKFLTYHEAKIENIKDLCGRLPLEGDAFFIWTVNSFNAFTFIPYLLKYAGGIRELIISTYSINKRIALSFKRYIDKGLIDRVHIFISDSIKYRMPAIVDLLDSMVRNSDGIVSVCYSWNHSKVTLVKTDGAHFVVEGSGNWSENSRHEQYVFLNSKQVYEFRAKWITSELHD